MSGRIVSLVQNNSYPPTVDSYPKNYYVEGNVLQVKRVA